MNRKTLWSAVLTTGLVVLPAACGGKDKTAEAASGSEITSLQVQPNDSEAMKAAKQRFGTLCQTCHGTSGHGDGPAGAALNPKPRSFADKDWQKSVTDDHIRTIIVQGGAAVGKSAAMPANPDLKSQPDVVNALVKIVRWFGTKGS